MLEVKVLFLFFYLLHCARSDFPQMQEIEMKNFIDDDGHGCTAAYGDVNSDKQTDLYALKEPGILTLYTGSQTAGTPFLTKYQSLHVGDSATSVVPADFNGDEKNDLLVVYKDGDLYSVKVFWGNDQDKLEPNATSYSEKLVDEPLVLDANGDMISDLFVAYENQSRAFLLGQKNKFEWKSILSPFPDDNSLPPVFSPHSHAFIDLTDDGSADLFVTSKDDDRKIPSYEVWKGTRNGMIRTDVIQVQSKDVGHATFADFTANAKQDIVVSTCISTDGRCTDSKIIIYTSGKWHTLFELPKNWSFSDTSELKLIDNTLHIADVNLDSHPDLMTIVADENGKRKAVVFYNIGCEADYCSVLGRQFGSPVILPNSDDVVYASFYDFEMDGSMDVIITTKKDGKLKMKGYKNQIADDVTFLRVQVLTGLSANPVYSVNIPGPQITYETTMLSGEKQLGRLGQLSQSAHMSLQLPFVIFGLGQQANFVDTLTVSIPVPLITDSSYGVTVEEVKDIEQLSANPFKPLNQTWSMLIPNSQLYVIPNPRNSPSSWSNKLLLTPGQNVVTTGLVLVGTMGVLVVMTMVLHWLERREDKQEKIQEAHRFHFDAM